MKRAIVFLFSGFFLLFSITILFFDSKVVASVLMGYVSAAFVLLASMRSYKKVVEKGIENETHFDDRDVIDKVEDPYMLFDEDEPKEEKREEDLLEVVKEERARLKGKGRSFVEVLKDSKASLAPYRLLSYALMIVGFVFLQRNELLTIIPYLMALTLPIVIVVATFIFFDKDLDLQKD
jgi:Ca2+/Na+ antiporter